MLIAFGAWLAKSALMQSPVGGFAKAIGGFLKTIPWQAWLAIGLAVALFFAVRHHRHQVEEFGKRQFAAGVASERAIAEANAARWKIRIDGLTITITNKLRSRSDAQIAAVDRAADAVLLRGPGRAVCPSVAGAARGAGGHVPATWQAGDAMAGMSDPGRIDLIAMPFPGAVQLVREHDACIIEAQTWRDQNRQLKDAWAKATPDKERADGR